jgi:hypothetical protein
MGPLRGWREGAELARGKVGVLGVDLVAGRVGRPAVRRPRPLLEAAVASPAPSPAPGSLTGLSSSDWLLV